MSQCVICGVSLKKKDSLMKSVYVCSQKCLETRKQQKPKKITSTTVEYWTRQGLSESEAKAKISYLQSLRSPRSILHWTNKGLSDEVAIAAVKNYQSACGKKNLDKYSRTERQKRSPFSPEYWKNKGFSKDESQHIVKQNSSTVSLDAFIKRHGAAGHEMYKNLCLYRKNNYTLAGYKNKHGQSLGKQLWSKKFKNRHNSKKACAFFSKLIDAIGPTYKIYTALNDNGEYGVFDHVFGKYYFYDFVVPALKLCVEFHGDYWHCNPKKYNPLFKHKQSGKTAKEIWDADQTKQDCIKRERQFDVIVVYESDDHDAKIFYIMEKINEFTNSKN